MEEFPDCTNENPKAPKLNDDFSMISYENLLIFAWYKLPVSSYLYMKMKYYCELLATAATNKSIKPVCIEVLGLFEYYYFSYSFCETKYWTNWDKTFRFTTLLLFHIFNTTFSFCQINDQPQVLKIVY